MSEVPLYSVIESRGDHYGDVRKSNYSNPWQESRESRLLSSQVISPGHLWRQVELTKWRIPFSRLPRSSAPGGLNVIQKEAWLSCRTSSGVRLYWELEEPEGPRVDLTAQ